MSNGSFQSWQPISGMCIANETYWYLEAVPELLQLATDRLLNNGKEDRS